jgi:hypothetical protein
MVIRNPQDPFGEGPEAAKARRSRSLAIALGLMAFIALVFVVTMIKLSGNGAG